MLGGEGDGLEDELWYDTPAEVFCLEALRTVERVEWDYPPEQVSASNLIPVALW